MRAIKLAGTGGYCIPIILAPARRHQGVLFKNSCLAFSHSGFTPLFDPCNSASFHPGIAPLCYFNAYRDRVGTLGL
jgi:hypothetical protein